MKLTGKQPGTRCLSLGELLTHSSQTSCYWEKKKKKSKLQARLEIQVVCTARIGQLLYFLKACEKTKLQKCVSEDEQVSCLLLLFKGSKFPPEAIQYARGIAWLADFLLPPRW